MNVLWFIGAIILLHIVIYIGYYYAENYKPNKEVNDEYLY